MLKFENVSLRYGSFLALDGVSLHADRGELVVLLGANGAGKSSLFLTASGIHKAAGGSIVWNGKELAGSKPSAIVQSGVVQCPEGRKLFPQMSVLRNLQLGAYVHRRDPGPSQKTLQEVMELFPILREKQHDPAGSLSGGQQQMVAIGRAMMGRPQALLLDEPSLGLAPLVIKQMFEAHTAHQRGRHHRAAGRAERLCGAEDRAPRLCDGKRPHRARGQAGRAAGRRLHPQGVHRRMTPPLASTQATTTNDPRRQT